MSELLKVLLVALHLLLVDVAMAGPLFCIWLEWRQTRRADGDAGRLGRSLAWLVSVALAGGIVTGAILLGIYWQQADQRFFTAAGRVPASRLWFALLELLFSLACMLAYAALWRRWDTHRWLHRTLAVAGSTNLLIHFPALFAIISILAAQSVAADHVLDRAGFQRMLIDSEVLSRVIHVWLAAVSVSAVTVMGLARRWLDANETLLVRHAAQAALLATALQIPVGMWFTTQLPDSTREPLVGADGIATTVFLVSLGLAMWLLQLLSMIAQGDCRPQLVRRAIGIMVLVVTLMTATLFRAKDVAQTSLASPARKTDELTIHDDRISSPPMQRMRVE